MDVEEQRASRQPLLDSQRSRDRETRLAAAERATSWSDLALLLASLSLALAACAWLAAQHLRSSSSYSAQQQLPLYLDTIQTSEQAMRPETARTLRLGTFNIRYGKAKTLPAGTLSYDDGEDEDVDAAKKCNDTIDGGLYGEVKWTHRRQALVDQIIWEELDVVGLQEVLNNQMQDIQTLLGPSYASVGVGRDDGKKAGEYAPIFYRTDRLELLSYSFFWLSETPDVPGSISWDAGQTRMVTMAKFQDRAATSNTSDTFFVLNTHWDDKGVVARAESAKLIRARAASLAGSGNLVVLTGDLNSPATEKGYQILTGRRYSTAKDSDTKPAFCDSRHELVTAGRAGHGGGNGGRVSGARQHAAYGERHTFTGFVADAEPSLIDFIMPLDNSAFVSGTNASASATPRWHVKRYGVLPNAFGGGRFRHRVSDHRLVVAALELV